MFAIVCAIVLMNNKLDERKNKIVKTTVISPKSVEEGGAAALWIILKYFDKEIPLDRLCAETHVCEDGTNALNILKCSRNYGLESKGYRIDELQVLRKISFPCVVHVDFNAFVVLEGFWKQYAYINAPGKGRYRLKEEDFWEQFTGIVLVFKPSEKFSTDDRSEKLTNDIKDSDSISNENNSTGFVVNINEQLSNQNNLVNRYSGSSKEVCNDDSNQVKSDQQNPQKETVIKPTAPIYTLIKNNLRDDGLPEKFNIPWIHDGWAAGAKDGVAFYHMHPLQDEDQEEKILEALILISDKNNRELSDNIFLIFEELESKKSFIFLIDDIQRTVSCNVDKLNFENIVDFGKWIACNGVSLLAIKLGLCLLAGFDSRGIREIFLVLGEYDEFTYYAARALSQIRRIEGNADLFYIARNVHGWGRIFAANYLRPETEEIRDWFLYEGAENNIISQYSSDVCIQKADVDRRLDSSLTAEEFHAIGILIDYCLQVGPCPGITDAENILKKYLSVARHFPINKTIILSIKKEAMRIHLSQTIIDETDQLLSRI